MWGQKEGSRHRQVSKVAAALEEKRLCVLPRIFISSLWQKFPLHAALHLFFQLLYLQFNFKRHVRESPGQRVAYGVMVRVLCQQIRKTHVLTSLYCNRLESHFQRCRTPIIPQSYSLDRVHSTYLQDMVSILKKWPCDSAWQAVFVNRVSSVDTK